MVNTCVLVCFIIIPMFIYCNLSIARKSIYDKYCWGETFDNVSYKCATFNSSVKICDIQFRENCSETPKMGYSSVVTYIKWNTFTQCPIIIIILIDCLICQGMDVNEHAAYIVVSVGLLTEAMQFTNYVLILTLVGPANGFMAANTTTTFRVCASIEGLLTGVNLALVITADDSGMCCVIMARVLLGDFVVATKSSDIPSTSRQPPCKECMTTVCKNTQNKPHPRFDAVVYTGGLYKEFVVYNNWQAYPEFIIFYKRVLKQLRSH